MTADEQPAQNVRVLSLMPDIKTADGPPWVQVFTEYVHVHRSGWRSLPNRDSFMVSPDTAGDLAMRPLAWISPTISDLGGVSTWQVATVGFTEGEAHEALEEAIKKLEISR